MAVEIESATGPEELLLILETALDAVVVMNERGIITGWNQWATTTFGWSSAEAIGRPLSALIMPEQYQAAHTAGLLRYIATGEPHILNRRMEITALRKDGQEFPVELSVTATGQAGSRVFVGFLRDITERTESARSLRESEASIRLILDSTAEGFYAVDQDGSTTLCNASFLKMLGFKTKAEAIGRKLHNVIHHTHPDGSPYSKADCPIYRCAQTGETAHVANEYFFRLDGTKFPVEYWVYPIMRDAVI